MTQEKRQELAREREHQLCLCAIIRRERLVTERELLPDGRGVRRHVLRARFLTPPDDEVPVSAIKVFLAKLADQEAQAEERARDLGKQLGLEES